MSRPYLAPDTTDGGAARRSLVLAGGGMRVAYQAGVLAALDQAGVKFHHVDGTSGGTINLSMVLSGLPVAEICERWRTLDQRRFAAPLPLTQYVRSPRWPGLGGGSGLRQHVFPHLGIDPAAIRAAEGVVGTYNLVNFATKTAEVIPHTDVDTDALVAAISLPVLMPAVDRPGGTYTDAVWLRDSNVPEAVRQGSDEAWLVWCIGNTPQYQGGLFRQYVQMIEIAANGSLRADLDRLSADPAGRQLRLHVIKPLVPLPLDPAYFFGRIDASTLIDLGYQDALRYLRDPQPHVAPWSADVTRMQTPPPAVAARLVFDGPFALGFAAPEAGAAAGRASGTSWRAELQFESTPGATSMRVTGHLDVAGWPARTLIDEGVARLGGRPPFELDASCTVGGTGWQVRVVTCAGGLAVRVYENGNGVVAGAGIVRFGLPEAAAAVPTIHTSNAISVAAGWRARVGMAANLWRAGRGNGTDG
jgi:predicted acylesterase/phospholipase RssA